MKILVITSKSRVEHFTDLNKLPSDYEFVWAGYDKSDQEMAEMAPDTEAILVDAISSVSAQLIGMLPKLKLIHSEGVGYEGIDVRAASERGIYVCNNRGCNAHAVAEQSILLMLAVLKRLVKGDQMTREGKQIQAKTGWIMEGIPELGSKCVGIIGMGDIGKATAKLCKAFGCEILYFNRHRLNESEESILGVQYESLENVLKSSDIVSLHIASNEQTKNFMNHDKLHLMKKDAVLINTARGEIVDNEALIEALSDGVIAAAGLDTVAPEPVQKDNPLLNLPIEIGEKITFSPHIGGVTKQTFQRIYQTVWNNIAAVQNGEEPVNVVNK